jgi:hypothetical protein
LVPPFHASKVMVHAGLSRLMVATQQVWENMI